MTPLKGSTGIDKGYVGYFTISFSRMTKLFNNHRKHECSKSVPISRISVLLNLMVLSGMCLHAVLAGKSSNEHSSWITAHKAMPAFTFSPCQLWGIRGGESNDPKFDANEDESNSEYDLDGSSDLDDEPVIDSSMNTSDDVDIEEDGNEEDFEDESDLSASSDDNEKLYDNDLDSDEEFNREQDKSEVVPEDLSENDVPDEIMSELLEVDHRQEVVYSEETTDDVRSIEEESIEELMHEYDDQLIGDEVDENESAIFDEPSVSDIDRIDMEAVETFVEQQVPNNNDYRQNEAQSTAAVISNVPYEDVGSTTTELLDDDESCIDRLDEADAYDDLIDSSQSVSSQAMSSLVSKANDNGTNSNEEKIDDNELSADSYLLESFISQLPSRNDKSVNFVITKRMRRMLVNELGYSTADVATMRPGVAALVIEKSVRCPASGMPQEWKDQCFIQGKKAESNIIFKNIRKFILPALSLGVASLIIGEMRSSIYTHTDKKRNGASSTGVKEKSVQAILNTPTSISADNYDSSENRENVSDLGEESLESEDSVTGQFQDLDDTWLDKLITNILDKVTPAKAKQIR